MTKMGMDRLEELVKRHGKWECGVRVNHYRLPDFTDARMINPDLSHLGLDSAIFKETYMAYANFQSAFLQRADFTNASLVGANFAKADLTQANFTGANLFGAVFRNARLDGALFDGAGLSHTCMDEKIHELHRNFCKECPPNKHGGRIVYRTECSMHIGSNEYRPGKTYVAPNLSFDVATDCNPGIYAASLGWMRHNYWECSRLAKCYVRDGDWIITAKGAIRCKRLRVLEIV